jgi:uncharacterized protein YeaO (DUF488 family)
MWRSRKSAEDVLKSRHLRTSCCRTAAPLTISRAGWCLTRPNCLTSQTTSSQSFSPRLRRIVWSLARAGRNEIIEVMAIRVVRLGTTRHPKEGLRIGTVRRPPRGVRKTEYARRNYFDVWLPELAPSAPLVSWALSEPFTPKRWTAYARRYRREMLKPASRRLIALLAALSSRTNFSVGCYCEDESRCHRSLLKQLLIDGGAQATGSLP